MSPTPRLRILRIIARLNVGGPAQHVLWLTQQFSQEQQGSFSTLLVTGSVAPGEQSMDYLAQNLKVQPVYLPHLSRKISWLGDIVSFFSLLRICFTFKPHIIHTHTAKAGALGRVCALFYRFFSPFLGISPRIKVFHTFHGHVFSGYFSSFQSRLIQGIERLLALTCHTLIVLSPEQKEDLAQRYRIAPARKLRIIPLGLDLERLETEANQAPKSIPPPYIIGWIGRVTAIKDPELLLEVALLAKHHQKPWIFWVIGGGELFDAIQQRIFQEKLPVELKGFQSQIGFWLKQMHLVLLTSKNEGTPLSLLEAMVLEKSVVATAVGGVPSLLAENRGRLVFSRTAEELFSAIEQQIQSGDLRNLAGKQWVEANYSLHRLIRDLESLYYSSLVRIGLKKKLLRLKNSVRGEGA